MRFRLKTKETLAVTAFTVLIVIGRLVRFGGIYLVPELFR